ncbi:hypothetical protein IWQ47_001010 [Aquimarina sp. EL_43]|nr:hypothetical protein [Aquimarina sp. EL_35]MBG6150753.1 hypothetical protein [Aquimarina sp. EL_32]MBG6167940.1 hypothetical protein [Aquimarina sp. EL_43]
MFSTIFLLALLFTLGTIIVSEASSITTGTITIITLRG